ncbi:type VI secretion system secreted protein VgrG [Oxalobacteraceae bacterium GrIS 1.11]
MTTELGTDVLLFRAMHGSEQLGRLSEYRVQLLSTRHDVKIADVLGKTMGIRLALPDEKVRDFNGIVTRFCCTGWSGEFSMYEATLHPWLWLLTRSSNCRIFQDKTVLEIIKEVCDDAIYGGMIDLSCDALGDYAALPYCVQYRETDFNFVCRLLENAGIYFFFRHDGNKHTMVLADSYAAHEKIPGYEKLAFYGEGGRKVMDQEGVFSWSAAGQIQSSTFVLNDFDFENAAASASGGLLVKGRIAAAFSQPAYEFYDYPGLYSTAAAGTALARVRMEGVHGQCEQVEADSDARGVFPGGLFALTGHPRDDQNRDYLVTGATYDIVGDDYAADAASRAMQFRCVFSAIGKEHAYRPPSSVAKPHVQGPQTAMVVGKAGEEIWTDKYGRVKVQFHWDRLGKDDEKSSCWVRVAQGWAGKGWGAMFVPRIGMEVVVSFLEGDPDRPLVTGCVYNADAMPPYALPAEQTKSTIRSNTSKGGNGYNELRFEDKKDAEEIFIQAEKDFTRVVKNNDTLKVGFEKKDKGDQSIAIQHDRSVDVGHDQSEHVGHDHSVTVDHDQKITVTNDQNVQVDNNQTVKVKADHKLDVGGDQAVTISGGQKVKAGQSIVIEAGSSIELKVGASSIKIEAGKITLKAPEILAQADASMTVKSGAMMSLKSGAMLTVEGALVKIN